MPYRKPTESGDRHFRVRFCTPWSPQFTEHGDHVDQASHLLELDFVLDPEAGGQSELSATTASPVQAND